MQNNTIPIQNIFINSVGENKENIHTANKFEYIYVKNFYIFNRMKIYQEYYVWSHYLCLI